MTIEKFRQASKECGNKYANVWEIVVEGCSETYGVNDGVTGCFANPNDPPCHETFKTCKSKCDFSCENKSYFFTDCDEKVFLNFAPNGFFPNVTTASYTAGNYVLCGGAPAVGSQDITIQDSRNSDYLGDPYTERRVKKPKDNGTGIEKFLQRNEVEGRLVRWYYGACNSSFPDSWISRNYFIDSVTPAGNDNCLYNFKLKDQFSIISSDKRTVPQTLGQIKTDSDINPFTSTIRIPSLMQAYKSTFSSTTILPKKIPICIDGYVYNVSQQPTDLNNAEGSIYKIIDKNICNTKPLTGDSKIESGAEVTIAKYWPKGTNIVQIIFDILFQDGVGIPSIQNFNSNAFFKGDGTFSCDCGPLLENLYDLDSFIELSKTCASMYFTDEIVICSPTSQSELLDEIAKSYLIAPYIDDFTGQIKVKQITPPGCEDEIYELDECVTASFRAKRNKNNRFTRVETWSDPADCSAGAEDLLLRHVDLAVVALESDDTGVDSILGCNFYQWVPTKKKKIQTRFFSGCNLYQDAHIGNRTLFMRKETPIEVEFEVTGNFLYFNKTDYICIRSDTLQDVHGCNSDNIFIVNSVTLSNNKGNCWVVKAESTGFKKSQKWATRLNCTDTCGNFRYDYSVHLTYDQLKSKLNEILSEECYNASVAGFIDGDIDPIETHDVNLTDPTLNPHFSGEGKAKAKEDFQENSVSTKVNHIKELYSCVDVECTRMW